MIFYYYCACTSSQWTTTDVHLHHLYIPWYPFQYSWVESCTVRVFLSVFLEASLLTPKPSELTITPWLHRFLMQQNETFLHSLLNNRIYNAQCTTDLCPLNGIFYSSSAHFVHLRVVSVLLDTSRPRYK